ncbi:hypothetical protein A2154_00185 [Candidatus Gottesmanbacteria bacterium RBG_16_43_7]|uniref:Sortase n=1 Tax=Candidatus Gottesmanbacteria bacterium RBG_16_43_7 TaxID=1798373 RepID=A0A1F5Z9G5_9BACT|nr:MAG: hypothetical protein A2154_00185 [Candidatus Gottesmanbacteria bacterium RBG_16_43_7]
MAYYRYVKSYQYRSFSWRPVVPFGLITIGVLLLTWVTWPILSFKLLKSSVFLGTVSPLPDLSYLTSDNPKTEVLAAYTQKETRSTAVGDPYSDPDIWFPALPQERDSKDIQEYYLSIPKLKIHNARVIVAGDDLNVSLIHYGGTAMPGEFGNTIIFGHSTLPALFNPKDYHTIFSSLPTLKPQSEDQDGDEIFIKFDGITYKYVVIDMVVTAPSDLTPLAQNYDGMYLTLITCVPPGTYWERLNIKAKLVTPQ